MEIWGVGVSGFVLVKLSQTFTHLITVVTHGTETDWRTTLRFSSSSFFFSFHHLALPRRYSRKFHFENRRFDAEQVGREGRVEAAKGRAVSARPRMVLSSAASHALLLSEWSSSALASEMSDFITATIIIKSGVDVTVNFVDQQSMNEMLVKLKSSELRQPLTIQFLTVFNSEYQTAWSLLNKY